MEDIIAADIIGQLIERLRRIIAAHVTAAFGDIAQKLLSKGTLPTSGAASKSESENDKDEMTEPMKI